MAEAKGQAPGSVAELLRPARPGRAALLLVLVLAACSSAGGAAAHGPATTGQAASSAASSAKLLVTSTLDGHAALPPGSTGRPSRARQPQTSPRSTS
jgi:hypothetical protein